MAVKLKSCEKKEEIYCIPGIRKEYTKALQNWFLWNDMMLVIVWNPKAKQHDYNIWRENEVREAWEEAEANVHLEALDKERGFKGQKQWHVPFPLKSRLVGPLHAQSGRIIDF